MNSRAVLASAVALLLVSACNPSTPDGDAGTGDGSTGDGGTDAASPPVDAVVGFDLSGSVDTQDTFFDFPYPSDLRLSPDGTPDLTGYPNPRVTLIDDLLPIAQDRPGWPVIPVAYFRFAAPITPLSLDHTYTASTDSEILLIDVDPSSPDRGHLIPTVAITFASDGYTGDNLVGVASYPGFVLHPGRKYAFVIRRGLNDARGMPLVVPDALTPARERADAGRGLGRGRRDALRVPLRDARHARRRPLGRGRRHRLHDGRRRRGARRSRARGWSPIAR